MNSQFQLGLELTNIFNPLAQAVSALGSLALIDAIKKGGSDALTELKLGGILGRNRIDSVIELHFKQVVAKSEKTVLSQYLEDIVLESGAGPTVQNALKNKELFSMVIQLSALCYVHEIQSFAIALIEAIDRNAQLFKAAPGSEPDFVSLCGTLRVIQQETASFRWSYLYESVEQQIESAFEHAKVDKADPFYSSRRLLPFSILQMLLPCLHQLQQFPEERILSIECTLGFSTLVVWCYHILGLNVKLLIRGCDIRFGKGQINVFIKESSVTESTASLLLPHAQGEPLFTLSSKDGDPVVGPELRSSARGFGRQFLRQILREQSLQEGDVNSYRTWVIRTSLNIVRSCKETGGQIQTYRRMDIIHAASYLFDLRPGDIEEAAEHEGPSTDPNQSRYKNSLSALVLILLSLTRVEATNLQECSDLPFCLSIEPLIRHYKSDFEFILSGGKMLALASAFDILSHILLGPMISGSTVDRAILVSARGWSLFFDSINKADPAELANSTLRIEFGLPNRRGVRKTRIVDGPTNFHFPPMNAVEFRADSNKEILFYPGVGRSKRGKALISEHSSDAFQMIQIFVRHYEQETPRTHILGFREMSNICAKFQRLPPCQCDHMIKYEDFISSHLQQSKPGFDKPPGQPELKSNFFWHQDSQDFHYPNESNQPSYEGKILDESVLFMSIEGKPADDEAWFFHVSNDPTARCMQICELYRRNVARYQERHNTDPCLFLRGPETCFRCAVSKVVDFFRQQRLGMDNATAFVLL